MEIGFLKEKAINCSLGVQMDWLTLFSSVTLYSGQGSRVHGIGTVFAALIYCMYAHAINYVCGTCFKNLVIMLALCIASDSNFFRNYSPQFLFPPDLKGTVKFLGPPTPVAPLGDNPVYAATETRPNGIISVAMDVAIDDEREFDNPLYGDNGVDGLMNEGEGTLTDSDYSTPYTQYTMSTSLPNQ